MMIQQHLIPEWLILIRLLSHIRNKLRDMCHDAPMEFAELTESEMDFCYKEYLADF